MVVVEMGNVLHHKKGRGIIRKKAMSGEYVQGKCPDPP